MTRGMNLGPTALYVRVMTQAAVHSLPAALRPHPVPDELTAPFWDAAKAKRLVIQRCQDCGVFQHPPAHGCPRCNSLNLAFDEVSGEGVVYTYIVIHDTRITSLEPVVPFVVGFVDLVEQPGLRLTCNFAGTDLADLRIGRPATVTFLELDNGMVLPDFALDKSDKA